MIIYLGFCFLAGGAPRDHTVDKSVTCFDQKHAISPNPFANALECGSRFRIQTVLMPAISGAVLHLKAPSLHVIRCCHMTAHTICNVAWVYSASGMTRVFTSRLVFRSTCVTASNGVLPNPIEIQNHWAHITVRFVYSTGLLKCCGLWSLIFNNDQCPKLFVFI